MVLWLTKFLNGQTSFAKVIIKGKRVNRGSGYGCVNRESGYGLEIPCEYHFHGDRFSCQWLREKLIQEKSCLNNTSTPTENTDDTFSDYGSSSNEINKIKFIRL